MTTTTYKYILIPGKPYHSSCPPDLYRLLFRQWCDFWSKEYSEYGSSAELDPMNFYRQDKYTAIIDGDQIVATHALTFFDLNYDFDKFEYFGEMHQIPTLERLKSDGLTRILVQQYFMVNSEYSVRKTGLNLSAVMAMLSLRNQKGYDGTLTAARTEVAAGSLALKIGFNKISESHLVHNVPVASFFCENPKPYRREQENDLVDYLWNTRLDFINSWRTENESQRTIGQPGQPTVPKGGEVSI